MIEQLATLAEKRKPVFAAAIVAGLLIAYIAMLYAVGDARLSDGKLTAADFSGWESVLISIGVCSILLLWLMGVAHAWQAGRRSWFVASILLWPVAIFYVLRLNTGRKAK